MPWPSAPTARLSSPGATTVRHGSGTRPPPSHSAPPCSTKTASVPSPSAPTARPSSPASFDKTGSGSGTRPTAKPLGAAPWSIKGTIGSTPSPSAPTARPYSPGEPPTRRAAQLWDAATAKPIGAPPCSIQGHRVHGRGLQPRRQSRPHRERGQDGAALGRGHRQGLSGRSLQHQNCGRSRGLQPRRQVGPHRERGQHGSALGRWATGKPLAAPLQHQGGVHAVAFSPDGKTVLTGSWDKDVGAALGRGHRQAPTRRPLAAPVIVLGRCRGLQPRRQDRPHRERGQDRAALGRGHRQAPRRRPCSTAGAAVNVVAFSPDGKTVLTGSRRQNGA